MDKRTLSRSSSKPKRHCCPSSSTHSKSPAARSSTGPRLRQLPFGSPTNRPQANGRGSLRPRVPRQLEGHREPASCEVSLWVHEWVQGQAPPSPMAGPLRALHHAPGGNRSRLRFSDAADPVLHSPTRFPISIEFEDAAVQQTLLLGGTSGSATVESSRTGRSMLVGGTADSLLHYVAFERAALGEDQGHRHLLADKFAPPPRATPALAGPTFTLSPASSTSRNVRVMTGHRFKPPTSPSTSSTVLSRGSPEASETRRAAPARTSRTRRRPDATVARATGGAAASSWICRAGRPGRCRRARRFGE